jgi:hypothetical protein
LICIKELKSTFGYPVVVPPRLTAKFADGVTHERAGKYRVRHISSQRGYRATGLRCWSTINDTNLAKTD